MKAAGMEDKLPRFQELGLLTANKFSFATGFVPGQGDPSLFVAEFIKPIFASLGMSTHLLKRHLCVSFLLNATLRPLRSTYVFSQTSASIM
eukprot:6216696-Amphidinium_carterae.3